MNSATIRKRFLEFMESKSHRIVPSAPMVIQDDPTLMFTNAGMNPFKDVFLGNRPAVSPRVADSQKCLRVSGKHNDLEEVGVDTYHHTMFEMLGNWSFGDYFKKEAIEWAWELLTKVYGLDPERLYATVFEGDAEDGLSLDSEAKEIWKSFLPNERILLGNKKDNFWEMGETGPCGPCSEVHIDLRTDEERAKQDGAELVNQDHPQVMEIWNLVFMEFNRQLDGGLKPLPAKHIDTGMGFERLCAALQGKKSNYDTDLFQPLIQHLERLTGRKYGEAEDTDIAMRVISDHIRAVAFAIADGQLPSNTGAGYVIRRILRRAVRYGYSFLDQEKAFIHTMMPVLIEVMGDHFDELKAQESLISRVIKEEEDSFLRTLSKGLDKLRTIMESQDGTIPGEKVFELYDTYGFPQDLTALILREKGMTMDEEGFSKELEAQKARSRKDADSSTSDWTVLKEDEQEEFVGYDRLSSKVLITRYRTVEQKGKKRYQLVFNITPFYAEGGGQVGDRGLIRSEKEEIHIIDTKKENNLIIHFSNSLPQHPHLEFEAEVDESLRRSTERNHSVTHLLHQALREVLGDHVQQKGSLVHPDYLRFDFSHFSKMEDGELKKVEWRVNELIREDHSLEEHRNRPMDEAMEEGAMALFGERYGDTVRTIRFGQSIELCGGTHVESSGRIGWFKITQETAVAAGIRRVEARTAEGAMEYVQERSTALEEVKALLKQPKDVSKAIQDLIQKNQELQKQIEALDREKAGALADRLLEQLEEVNGMKVFVDQVDVDAQGAKDIIFRLKDHPNEERFILLAYSSGDKVGMSIGMSRTLIKEKGWNAGQLIREWAKEIQGGGGGQPDFASAGGKKAAGIPAALTKAREYLEDS